MTDPDAVVTLTVKHQGKLYRRGPWRIFNTTSPKGQELKEVTFVTWRLLNEILRDIRHEERKRT